MMYPDGMSTTSMAMPEVGLSSVKVQLKHDLMVISDLFRPWKYSWSRLDESVLVVLFSTGTSDTVPRRFLLQAGM
jgi:hypothetical protein